MNSGTPHVDIRTNVHLPSALMETTETIELAVISVCVTRESAAGPHSPLSPYYGIAIRANTGLAQVLTFSSPAPHPAEGSY